MSRKRFTPEQIIHKLREAEVELAKGQVTAQVCKRLGVLELMAQNLNNTNKLGRRDLSSRQGANA